MSLLELSMTNKLTANRRLINWVRSFHPRYWIRNYATSQGLADEINRLLDSGVEFTEIGVHRANLGHLNLWIQNHPYASFERHGCMPDRRTVIRASDALDRCRFRALDA